MSIVLLSLVLAFLAGVLVTLVAQDARNTIADWREERALDAIDEVALNAISEDLGAWHVMVDGVCQGCGFAMKPEPWWQGANGESLRRDGIRPPVAATNTASAWDNVTDETLTDDELDVVRAGGYLCD